MRIQSTSNIYRNRLAALEAQGNYDRYSDKHRALRQAAEDEGAWAMVSQRPPVMTQYQQSFQNYLAEQAAADLRMSKRYL